MLDRAISVSRALNVYVLFMSLSVTTKSQANRMARRSIRKLPRRNNSGSFCSALSNSVSHRLIPHDRTADRRSDSI